MKRDWITGTLLLAAAPLFVAGPWVALFFGGRLVVF